MYAHGLQGPGSLQKRLPLLSMLVLINIIYLAQNLAINKSQQYPTNPDQNHMLALTQFLVLNLYF